MRLAYRFGLVSFLLLAVGFSWAQQQAQSDVEITQQGIVVNPKPSPTFSVRVRVDKDPTGKGVPIYFYNERASGKSNQGDAISVNVLASENAYVYLFNVRSDGRVVQFYPNRLSGSDNFVRAGTEVRLPPAGAMWEMTVEAPYGIDQVVALASKRPVNTHELAWFANENAPQGASCGSDCFAESNLGQMEFATTLGIIVGEVQQSQWITDTVRFQIRRK